MAGPMRALDGYPTFGVEISTTGGYACSGERQCNRRNVHSLDHPSEALASDWGRHVDMIKTLSGVGRLRDCNGVIWLDSAWQVAALLAEACSARWESGMSGRIQIKCAWLGIICPLLFFGGLMTAGFFPPMRPMQSAQEVAAIYRQNTVGIRLGALIMMISAAFYLPFTAVIAAQVRKIERGRLPILTYAQVAAGVSVVNLFFLPALFWTVAAFRPDRSLDVTQALNDLAWLTMLMPFMLAAAQNIALAVAIFSDRNEEPIFPRWLAYFNIWIALLLAPGGFITFFKTGPLAWHGLLGFWIPVLFYGPWFFVVGHQIIKMARRQAAIVEMEA